MSYANGTPFLNLAQTIGTDHRDWFDENEAKLDLDTKMKTLWDGAADTATILSSLQESVSSLDTDVTTLQGTVSGHTSSITTINESLVLINTALNALNTQVTNKFDSAGIADPYDATHGTYDIGDVVTYNGQRYVCSIAVTAAEPFDVSKWTAEDVESVITEGVVLGEVVADGVKTRKALLEELFNSLDSNRYMKYNVLHFQWVATDGGRDVGYASSIRSNQIEFIEMYTSGGTRHIYTIIANASSASYTDLALTTSGNTETDYTSNVPGAGNKFRIIG